jgi:preprotein translocase subunit SecG
MTILFVILIILASVILGLIVLIQNPKGGGLAGTFGGLGTQFMGVKQTTDVLEKGTWIFAGVIVALCLFSKVFIGGPSTGSSIENTPGVPVSNQQQAPATQSPIVPDTNR